MLRLLLLLFVLGTTFAKKSCGGVFTAKRGVLHTPNFPGKFSTPIECEWIIKAEDGETIVVYPTQMYLYEGLTFTEKFAQDHRVPDREVSTPKGEDFFNVNYIQSHMSVLVINLKLNSLDNNNLRVLYGFMDVYGFNITYEITKGKVRKDHCTVMDCMLNGICYDYVTHFGCQCFPGYSGKQCLEGPKSGCFKNNVSVCQNGANCSHIGDKGVMCHCRSGFTGQFCEVVEQQNGCEGCLCMYDSTRKPCECSEETDLKQFKNDLQVFRIVARFENLPSLEEDDLRQFIKNEISHQLQDFQIRNIHISSYESHLGKPDVTVRFYGPKSEEAALSQLRDKWVEMGYVGNMTVASADIGFYHQPIIRSIVTLSINKHGAVHELEQFALSCKVQASPLYRVRWYKDGILVNVSRISDKWTFVKKLDSTSQSYVAVLTVDSPVQADSGRYTCQVEDYGVQQCLSIRVRITAPPEVALEPLSLTVFKGQPFRVECSSDTKGQTSYSWAKNGELLPTRTKREHYETLYLTGSLLKVNGLNKSANYSCLVQRGTVKHEKSIYVVVIDRRTVKPCRNETRYGITWSEAAPGYESIQQCPENYRGVATRACVMRDTHYPEWDMPDMSDCVSTVMGNIIMKFGYLQLGYEATTPAKTLLETLNYLGAGTRLLDGEGSVIAKLIAYIASYVRRANYSDDVRDVCKRTGAVADGILRQNQSLVMEKQVIELQQSLKEMMYTCKLFLPVTEVFTDVQKLVTMHLHPINKLTNFTSCLSTPTTTTSFKLIHVQEKKQYSASIANIIYLNLHKFLPYKSVLRINGAEVNYEIVSTVSTAWYINDSAPKSKSFELMYYFTILKYINREKFNLTCVRAEFAPYEYFWSSTSCDTEMLNSTSVKCNCNDFGTFTILALELQGLGDSKQPAVPNKIIVLVGCTLCLFLSVFTGILLLFHWVFNRSSITFLKLQCTASVIGGMGIFITAQTRTLQEGIFLCTQTFLQVFLLTGLSTQLCILLIIYADLLQFKRSKGIKPTSICVVTGPPFIIVFGNYLSHLSMNLELGSWWTIVGTASFYVFLICCGILIFSFHTMYVAIMKHVKCNDDVSISKKRVILFNRSFYIFYAVLVVIASSVLYINMIENIVCHLVFSIASATLGFVILLCYVLKSDDVLEQYFLKKINEHNESSKPNLITSNSSTPRNEKLEQCVSSSMVNTEIEQMPQNSKHVVISIDGHKNIKSSIKTPDILSSESCVKLDLVTSNQNRDKHCRTGIKHHGRKCGKIKMQKRICRCCVREKKASTVQILNITDSGRSHKATITDSSKSSMKLDKLHSTQLKINSQVDTACEVENSPSVDVGTAKIPIIKNCKISENCSQDCVPRKSPERYKEQTFDTDNKRNKDSTVGSCENSFDNQSSSGMQDVETVTLKSKENLDAVMSSISEDLDYLLNRSSEIK